MISVIIPVKNGEGTIEAALQSILNQSFQDFEIIVIDDHSTDSASSIIENLSKKSGKIRVIKNEKSVGVGSSLNIGLQQAQYEFVARMDADDEALPDRLKHQLEFMQKNPDVAVVGGQISIMGSSPKYDYPVKYESDLKIIKEAMLKNNVLAHPAVMYRKSVILKIGGYRGFFKNAEDYDLWLRLIRNGREIANLNENLLRYNLSIGGATIGNRWVQYVYHRLAQHAYYFPDDVLDETLYKKIELKYIHLRPQYIIATYAFTLSWLLKCRQFKKAWRIFKLIPNKLSFYSIKKIFFGIACGVFKIESFHNVDEFYTPYS